MPINQFACTLSRKKELTPSVSLYTFEVKSGSISFIPGQFVSFVFQNPLDGARFVRSYSLAGFDTKATISSSPKGPVVTCSSFELLIVHLADGKGTSILAHASLGSVFQCTGPAGNLVLKDANAHPARVFLASSTGVAPFRAMMQCLARMDEPPSVHIYWGMKTAEDLYLLDEWRQWSLLWNKKNAVCRFTVCLSQQSSLPTPDEPLGLRYTLGRIQKNLNALPSDTYQIYICGGKNFVVDTKEFVLKNYPLSEVFVERFN